MEIQHCRQQATWMTVDVHAHDHSNLHDGGCSRTRLQQPARRWMSTHTSTATRMTVHVHAHDHSNLHDGGCPRTHPSTATWMTVVVHAHVQEHTRQTPSSHPSPLPSCTCPLRRQIWPLRCPVPPDPHHPHSCRGAPGQSRGHASGRKSLS